MQPSLDIVIVNWNAGQQLGACLESIAAADRSQFRLNRVIVVDNASSDGSADQLAAHDLPLTVLRNSENRGFAAACNQGAQHSAGDYLLFLNPDTRLNHASLSTTIRFMQENVQRRIGICGIQLIDDRNTISRTCARFPRPRHFVTKLLGLDYLAPRLFPSYPMIDWDHRQTRTVDQVIGAFFLVRRQVFEALHGFDERFFVYFEELDFSLRARQAGWSSVYLTTAQAYHKGGGTSEQVKARRLFYALRSRILYSYKHFDPFSATIVLLATLCIEPLTRLALAVARSGRAEIMETLSAYGQLWRTMPQIMLNRNISRS